MDQNNDVSAEELAQEQTALGEIKEEDVRSQVITEYGFDPETDKERIDKAVQREMGYKKSLSSAIGQKIKYRNQLQSPQTPPPATPAPTVPSVDVPKAVAEELDRRYLASVPYPDTIKTLIQNVAKINGFTVQQAEADPYVASHIETWRKSTNADQGAITRNNNSGGQQQTEIGEVPDYDLTTEEGRKGYDKWKQDQINAGF